MNDTQAGAPVQNEQQQPPLTVVTQYLKDFSFENPAGAENLTAPQAAPTGAVKVDVRMKQLTQADIEVSLLLGVEAKSGEKVLYVAEVDYAGIFRLGRVPQEAVMPLLTIEAPRLLFPFARNLISLATQNGGFPPLNINPIDFTLLYRQRQEEMLRQQKQAEASAII
ncbi:MAG TPA: protein-export chaperone SecB [Dongiaceae bacterium]|jgi:preprotein translocase subunit SecB|nr:protein-export chaperone SecB [Dongiaceae bacterium]